MAIRMLIDARHREETRVAVVENNRIEEFDFESAEHKQLKGNIYLAKVTRVEPSLQAAFVDYGGNRHGFLAFSEIHPDYYQIPKEDREALLAEEAEHAREEAALRDEQDDDAAGQAEDGADAPSIDEVAALDDDAGPDDEPESDEDAAEAAADAEEESQEEGPIQDLRRRRMNLRRRYKIQDVIHRRQVLLVQVVKEERGTKGAALTTYLSLAGRYCVLMPNTSHGGGISRKISNAADRKRLKSVIAELKLPDMMGCIVRTAGMSRTKTEIKRDFTYLARLWDEIRDNTLKSSAPARIHNDSDLIKRAIRDIYNREIEEVMVEGDDGYKAARDFMKLLMPSHARRVKQYADPTPLFQRFHVEDQLGAMYQPTVQLKSGGYLVINPTEALVSIDINSGRSTREHNIEQTALKTNIEAAREIARQLRLRDMAGLIVIDFIDMDHSSNNRKVEKAIKDALKHDRARIQVGRISSFGLLEMSRQRLRTGVLEASTIGCPHCDGTGLIRTAASAGLSALRMVEEEAARGRGSQIRLVCSQSAAVYVLNAKRAELIEIEERYGVSIAVIPDTRLDGAAMSVESAGPPPERRYVPEPLPVEEETAIEDDDEDAAADDDEDAEETEDAEEAAGEEARESRRGDRKRRSRRGGRGRSRRDEGAREPAESSEDEADEPAKSERGEDEEEQPRRSRRGRRGGKRRRGSGATTEANDNVAAEALAEGEDAEEAMNEAPLVEPDAAEAEAEAEAKPAKRRARRRPAAAKAAEARELADEDVAEPEQAAEAEPPKPARARRSRAKTPPVEQAANDANGGDEAEAEAEAKPKRASRARKPAAKAIEAEESASGSNPDADAEESGEPRRGGWWQRTFGT